MFERFTEKAIKVVILAQEESRRLGHGNVGSEQLLLGIIGEGSGLGSKALRSVGVTLQDARKEVEKLVGRGSGHVPTEIPFTPRAKRILGHSWDEARELGHTYIGTEHLLLGILDENAGVAIQALNNMHLDIADLRRRIYSVLPGFQTGPLPEEPLVPDEIGDITEGPFVWYRLDALTTMKRAKAAAEMLGHDVVQSAHIFMGLLQDENAISNPPPSFTPIDLTKLRAELLQLLPPGGKITGVGSMPISAEAQDDLRHAWLQAAELKSAVISRDALILGLIREGRDGAKSLAAAGINPGETAERIREAVKAEQQKKGSQSDETTPTRLPARPTATGITVQKTLIIAGIIAVVAIILALSQH